MNYHTLFMMFALFVNLVGTTGYIKADDGINVPPPIKEKRERPIPR